MTVAPNRMRLGLLETRHPELSVHIKYEEKGAWKGLQTAAQKLSQNTLMLATPCHGWVALVYPDTLMINIVL